MYKSGFITIVGRPNVGKSTLLNQIIGEKIAIISDKPQTTRNKIQMVYTEEAMQIVFLDTPGIQMPKNKLGEYMLNLSKSTLEEVDVITFIVDGSEKIGKLDQYILDQLDGVETPVVLVINKIDTITQEALQELVDKFEKMDRFEKVIPISALNNQGVEDYIRYIETILPEGPQYFPEDMITDQPERVIIAEIIREKALLNLEDEIPHGIVVDIEKIAKREGKDLLDVYATIFVEKKSHKGMVIGKGGSMISKIGSQARADIETLMGTKINLQLWIKIEKDWRDRKDQVKRFGYH